MEPVVKGDDNPVETSKLPTDGRLNPSEVAELYVQHSDELRRFLIGVLHDQHLAADVLHVTFAKAMEIGHTARAESIKGWLFSVAYHEAMAIRRRQGIHERATRSISYSLIPIETAEISLTRTETVQQVQAALDQLPPDQQAVVRLRVYDQKKFAEIAEELNLPLGTVLTRMRSALGKLRIALQGGM